MKILLGLTGLALGVLAILGAGWISDVVGGGLIGGSIVVATSVGAMAILS